MTLEETEKMRELYLAFLGKYAETADVVNTLINNHALELLDSRLFRDKKIIHDFRNEDDWDMEDFMFLMQDVAEIIYCLSHAEESPPFKGSEDGEGVTILEYFEYLMNDYCFHWIEDQWFCEMEEMILSIINGDERFEKVINEYSEREAPLHAGLKINDLKHCLRKTSEL